MIMVADQKTDGPLNMTIFYSMLKTVHILRRMIQASTKPDALVLDFFAGSGTTGVAALELGRRFILVDNNPEAIAVMTRRFDGIEGIDWIGINAKSKTTVLQENCCTFGKACS